jgi:hypothetical protein
MYTPPLYGFFLLLKTKIPPNLPIIPTGAVNAGRFTRAESKQNDNFTYFIFNILEKRSKRKYSELNKVYAFYCDFRMFMSFHIPEGIIDIY